MKKIMHSHRRARPRGQTVQKVAFKEIKGAAAVNEAAEWKWDMHRAVVINHPMMKFKALSYEVNPCRANEICLPLS